MYLIAGVSGKTGAAAATALLEKRQAVRVLVRSEEKGQAWREKGAEVAVASLDDVAGLTRALTGVKGAYLLVPPDLAAPDYLSRGRRFLGAMAEALGTARVPHVAFLSSIGAQLEKGTGPVVILHEGEKRLVGLRGTRATFIRAGYFMENTLMMLSMIKNQGIMGNPAAPDKKISLVATRDIATYAAQILSEWKFTGCSAHDLYGDQLSFNEIAAVLSRKLALPGLKYIQFPPEQAVAAMDGISKSAQQITHIIGVIDEIAFQTNLLALNAGVEAARAGDAGRGFAVVASEVRALAQRSAEAAKEIKGLISSSATQVGLGVDLVGQTGKALERIVAQVIEIDNVVSAIAKSAEEQAGALQQVDRAVSQMDQSTQRNAEMAQQTTAAAHALALRTGELEGLTSRFGVTRSGARSERTRVRAARFAAE